MPELPEVETIRRSLVPGLVGQAIADVRFGAFPGVIGAMDQSFFAGSVIGRQMTDIRRRGKYLLIDLDDGTGIEVHLRMTGNLTLVQDNADRLRFEYLALALTNGMSLRYSDQRKFGRVLFRATATGGDLERKLGPEPLSSRFTSEYLAGRLRGRAAPVKALILDQRIIAGVGNIYADEALFRSRLHPLRPGGSLSESEITSLLRSIRYVLRAGIENRGTSFSSYRDGYGEVGANQFRLRIYGRGRSGEPCLRCGGPLTIVQAGGRSSHVCIRCQPLE